MLTKSRGSESPGHTPSGILQLGQESHQSMRSWLLDAFSGCTLHGLWRFICGYIFASLHHSLYVFLKVKSCLFFSSPVNFHPAGCPLWEAYSHIRNTSSHCSQGTETLPLYSDKSNTCFLNSPATCDGHWPERKSASTLSPCCNLKGCPLNKTKLILFAGWMGICLYFQL